ncbi:MAG: hypothetical protein AUJ52_01940 [Elusimicrobia bacterium CG1_02_63_36]|nr:MAG: hypothetical protein AUJ52_01940 [Elusimicrobia bacterium CG1_02_63_36]PIP81901.1 MAG: hypothetical protein COR54_17695 [Elusimicrobia bacterium CG22_combo_CG10-13_8_21_14_all_63_91]PJA15042.1 MAG: hypothetical protein COX66_11030 [Elusimicrobia bacterium CG_4_10_14_0_2_um_filter_63_34]PJB27123.1 MAG: hypothetical protein CO113_00025 [Elusimicrobia bacterium CG_4_9_14_3_um_filter_62_55]
MRAAIALLGVLLLAAPAGALQSNRGGAAMEFLRVGAGARALGMGDAFGPIAEGPNAIYWNPAGIVQNGRPEASFTHVEMLQFFHHEHAAYVHPFPKSRNAIAFSATLFTQDKLDLVSNTNQLLGTFAPHSEAYTFAAAHAFGAGDTVADSGSLYDFEDRPIHEVNRSGDQGRNFRAGNAMVGIAGKFLTETLNTRKATAFAVDGGLLLRPETIPELALSAVIRNVGSRPKFREKREVLPTELSLGAAYSNSGEGRRFIASFEAGIPFYGTPYGKAGLEYSAGIGSVGFMSFRAGYKSISVPALGGISGITAGVGFGLGRIDFDFGFQPMAELGEVYRGSIGIRF